MKIRIGKAVSLFALCLVVPMAIRAQGTQVNVTCNDGTTSASVGKGACSGHGGVKAKTTTTTKSTTKTTTAPATKAKTAATKAAKPATKTAAKSTKTTKTAAAAKPAATASAADKDPKDATASCKDGTYSHAATHTGACSGHGGVLKFLK